MSIKTSKVPEAAGLGSVGRSAGRVGGGIFLSRILGLVREQVFAYILGAGKLSDAFIVAFRIPNLLRDLFAEGALSQSFVPVFSRSLVNESQQKAYQFANKVIALLLLVVGSLTVLGYLFTVPMVQAIMPVQDPDKLLLTVKLTRIILPFLLFVSLAAVTMGMLNAQKVYFIPAVAPAVFNVVAILSGFVIFILHSDPTTAVVIWTFGALLGGCAQFAVQLPALFKRGFRFSSRFDPGFKDKNVRQLLLLMGPSIIGVAAVEINIFINTMLASSLGDGAVTWLNYAFRLIQLPIGLFGVAIATVTIVHASHAAATKDMGRLKDSLADSLKLNFLLSFAATAGLVVLGKEIVQLIYQHGRFQAADTLQTYGAILFYCTGLFAYSAVKVTVPVFYALSNSRVPVIASFCAVVANLIVSLGTYKILGVKGLALGTAAGAIVNFSLLLGVFTFKYGGLKGRDVGRTFFLAILASALMAALLFALLKIPFVTAWGSSGFLPGLVVVSGLIVTAIGAYAGITQIMRIKETSMIISLIRRKLKV